MQKFLLICFFAFTSSLAVFAHEGHDHGSGQVQPTKGGVIQKAGNIYYEVVGSKEDIKVYPMKESGPEAKTLKAVSLNEVKISATYKLPRGKAAMPITFNKMNDHFAGKVSAQGAHRYQIDLKVESGTLKDEIIYQIEPQE
jgi:hypothetical protein